MCRSLSVDNKIRMYCALLLYVNFVALKKWPKNYCKIEVIQNHEICEDIVIIEWGFFKDKN